MEGVHKHSPWKQNSCRICWQDGESHKPHYL